MKVFVIIFLFVNIFIQTFSTYIIQADFYLNQSYIAKNLCVNRDKPMMHCNGKCYLSKKINEQEKQNHQTPISKNERSDFAPFFVPRLFLIATIFSNPKMEFFIKNEVPVSSIHQAIFHPPTA